MIDFTSLATTAALGAASRPLSPDDLPAPIAGFVDGSAEPAARLLDAAAAWAVARQARVAPGPDVPPLRLPPATRTEAPAPVVALLHRIRSAGAYRDGLQHEALQALGARGLGLPPDLLLSLLAEVHRGDLARDLAGTLDERGWALVGLDPTWSAHLAKAGATSAEVDPRDWDEGNSAQRVAHLATQRADDPQAGRRLLETAGFAREPAEAREAFVRALATGLNPDDEDFLEARLGDRARGVREAAAGLLSRLAGSAYVARAEALAVAAVQRRQRLLRSAVTVVSPVPATDQTARDQYREADAEKTPTERLHLFQVLVIVPTHRWTDLVGASAVDLATGPAEYNGNPIDLRPAFADAARRWRDAELARELVGSAPELLPMLVDVLGPDDRERLLAAALASGKAAGLLDTVLDQPLSGDLSVAALHGLERLATDERQLHRVAALAARLAVNADADAASALVAGLRSLEQRIDETNRLVRRELAAAAAALQLRIALAEALSPYPVLPNHQRKARP